MKKEEKEVYAHLSVVRRTFVYFATIIAACTYSHTSSTLFEKVFIERKGKEGKEKDYYAPHVGVHIHDVTRQYYSLSLSLSSCKFHLTPFFTRLNYHLNC